MQFTAIFSLAFAAVVSAGVSGYGATSSAITTTIPVYNAPINTTAPACSANIVTVTVTGTPEISTPSSTPSSTLTLATISSVPTSASYIPSASVGTGLPQPNGTYTSALPTQFTGAANVKAVPVGVAGLLGVLAYVL